MTVQEIFQQLTEGRSRSSKVKEMTDLLHSKDEHENFLNALLVLVRSKDASASAPIFVFLDGLFANIDTCGTCC